MKTKMERQTFLDEIASTHRNIQILSEFSALNLQKNLIMLSNILQALKSKNKLRYDLAISALEKINLIINDDVTNKELTKAIAIGAMLLNPNFGYPRRQLLQRKNAENFDKEIKYLHARIAELKQISTSKIILANLSSLSFQLNRMSGLKSKSKDWVKIKSVSKILDTSPCLEDALPEAIRLIREMSSAADNKQKSNQEDKVIKANESAGISLHYEAWQFMVNNQDYFTASIAEISRFRQWALSQENVIYRTHKQVFKLLSDDSVYGELRRQYKKAVKTNGKNLLVLLGEQPELTEAILQLKRPVDEKEKLTVVDIWKKTWEFTPKITPPEKITAKPERDFRTNLLDSLQREIAESKQGVNPPQNLLALPQAPVPVSVPQPALPAQRPRSYVIRGEGADLVNDLKEKMDDLSANSQGCWSKSNKIWAEKHGQLKKVFHKLIAFLIDRTEAHLADLVNCLDMLDKNVAIKTYCLGPMSSSFFPFKDKTSTLMHITKVQDYVNKTIIYGSSKLTHPALKAKLEILQSSNEIPMHFF